jgi:class 3 adenylate cyclase
MSIVNETLHRAARRNERALALARLTMSLAFSLRLVILYPEDLAEGHFKDWLVLIIMLATAFFCAVHLRFPPSEPTATSNTTSVPAPFFTFRRRQTAFVGVDLLLVCTAVFPAVLWPEPTYQGLLLTPFVGIGALVAMSSGMRLRPRLAGASASVIFAIVAVACVVDLELNGAVVRWGVGEVVYYAVELGGASLLGILFARRTLSIAREAAGTAIDAERARERFGAYVGREVAEEAMRGDAIVLGGVRQPVAVLFSDLRGFTSYAENLTPETLVAQLNAYLEEMVAVITAHGGVVDKYIGDGIMAVFGAPRTRPDDASRAVRAAAALVKAMDAHNRRRGLQGLPPLKMGVGVHYGAVVAGNIGTIDHAQYTIIGDVVNLASRLESSTKDLGVALLVSGAAREAAADCGVGLRPLGKLQVRGRSEEVTIFGLEPEPP